MDILKTTEIDIIWAFVYTGMAVSVFAVVIVIYGTFWGDK